MSKVRTLQFVETYKGYNIFWSRSSSTFLVDTEKIMYFRNSLSEIKFIIDNLKGYQVN